MSLNENIKQINLYTIAGKNKWNQNYELLKECLKEHDGKYPKQNEIYQREKIGFWMNNQRTIYNNGEKQSDGSIRYNSAILTKEEIQKLNEIGFIWDYREYLWQQNYELLKEYLKENNRNYPKQNEIYQGEKIGTWINTQRSIYNNGEKQNDGSIRYNSAILTKEEIQKLNEINFIWIFNKQKFKKRIIKTKGQLEGARRYLLNRIEELDKENIKSEELNKKLLLRL